MAQLLFHSWLENEGGGGVVKNWTSKLKGGNILDIDGHGGWRVLKEVFQ